MQHVLVELQVAEVVQALFALVLVVLPGRIPPLSAARAQEVSIVISMVPYHLRVPTALIKHVFASRAPVASVG